MDAMDFWCNTAAEAGGEPFPGVRFMERNRSPLEKREMKSPPARGGADDDLHITVHGVLGHIMINNHHEMAAAPDNSTVTVPPEAVPETRNPIQFGKPQAA